MKRVALGVLGLGLLAGLALAAVPGVVQITSLVGTFALPIDANTPQSSVLPVNGETFTCASGAATIANTAVNSGSLILMTLKTVGGTVAAPFVATITSGTGFTVTCGGSDSSTYNFIILG